MGRYADETVECGDGLFEDLDRVGDVVLADHHTLRRAGSARGVDESCDVFGLGRRGQRLEVRWRRIEEFGGQPDSVWQWSIWWFDDVDVLEQRKLVTNLEDPVEERTVFHDCQFGFGMVGQVLDLFGR